MLTLRRHPPVALYFQIQEDIRGRIEAGELQPGDRLEPESVLEARYGVSRITVRQALSTLATEGLIEKRQGKGTFVRAEKVAQRTGVLTSFTEEMRHRDLPVLTRVLGFEVRIPPEAIRRRLQLSPGEQVVFLRRLRLVGAEALAFTEAALPERFVPDLPRKTLVDGSLYRTLEEIYGLVLAEADEEIEAKKATTEERRLLGIIGGSPILQITRTTYLATGEPVEYARVAYKAERFKYYLRLKGRR